MGLKVAFARWLDIPVANLKPLFTKQITLDWLNILKKPHFEPITVKAYSDLRDLDIIS